MAAATLFPVLKYLVLQKIWSVENIIAAFIFASSDDISQEKLRLARKFPRKYERRNNISDQNLPLWFLQGAGWKSHYVTLTSYSHKWHRSINRRRTRPSLGQESRKGVCTLRKEIKKRWYFPGKALALKLSPNHYPTSNFGWLCTQSRLMCIAQTSCTCHINLRMRSTT